MMTKIDVKACRERARMAFSTDEERQVIKFDVPRLCDRVELLEAALTDLALKARGGHDDLNPEFCNLCRALAAVAVELEGKS